MYCPNCGNYTNGEEYCPVCGEKIEVAESSKAKQAKPKLKPKINLNVNLNVKKLAIPGAIAAAVVVGLIVAVNLIGAAGGSTAKSCYAMVYEEDNELYIIPDVREKNVMPFFVSDIGDTDSFRGTGSFIGADSEYKYIYFNRWNGDKRTVCMIPTSKISRDRSATKQNVVEIDDDEIDYYNDFYILDNGRALYIADDDELMYFDGSDSYRIDKGVSHIDYDFADKEIPRGIYYACDEKYEDVYKFELKYCKLEKNPNPVSIDSDVSWSREDMDFVAYGKDEDIYASKDGGEPVKVADDAEIIGVNGENGSVFYTKEGSESLSYYDLLDNDARNEWGNYYKEELKDSWLDFVDLYYWKNGKDTLIAENVLVNFIPMRSIGSDIYAETFTDEIYYFDIDAEELEKSVTSSDILESIGSDFDSYSVRSAIQYSAYYKLDEHTDTYVWSNGKTKFDFDGFGYVCQMSGNKDYVSIGNLLPEFDNAIFKTVIYTAAGNPELTINETYAVFQSSSGNVYYLNSLKEDSYGNVTCDLKLWNGKEIITLEDDTGIYYNSICELGKDSVLYATGDGLKLYSNGSTSKVASNVEGFYKVSDDTAIYMTYDEENYRLDEVYSVNKNGKTEMLFELDEGAIYPQLLSEEAGLFAPLDYGYFNHYVF